MIMHFACTYSRKNPLGQSWHQVVCFRYQYNFTINFIYLTEDAFVSLYKSLVRCHLEYANSVWTLIDKGRLKT